MSKSSTEIVGYLGTLLRDKKEPTKKVRDETIVVPKTEHGGGRTTYLKNAFIANQWTLSEKKRQRSH